MDNESTRSVICSSLRSCNTQLRNDTSFSLRLMNFTGEKTTGWLVLMFTSLTTCGPSSIASRYGRTSSCGGASQVRSCIFPSSTPIEEGIASQHSQRLGRDPRYRGLPLHPEG